MEQINLNIIPDGVMPVCHASQFDKNRTIRFNLNQNGSVYTLAGTETITCKVRKPDDTESTINVANTSSSYVDVTFGFSDTDLSGYAMCELKIVNGAQTIGSRNFLLNVEADAYDGSVFEERSASGEIASFETNFIDNLTECIVDIDAVQDLHGYEKPWAGGAGKNKCKPLDNPVTRDTGITVTPQTDGSVILNGTKVGSSSTVITDYFGVKQGVTYVVSIGSYPTNIIDYGIYGFGHSKVITHSSDYNSIGIQLFITEGAILDNIRLYPQIEEGSTATPYAPYENICPISGHSTCTIKVNDDIDDPQTEITTAIPLGQTVYGGSLNVTTGLLTITHGIVTYSSNDGFIEHPSGRFYKNELPDNFDYLNSASSISNVATYADIRENGAYFAFGGSGVYINKLTPSETLSDLNTRLSTTPMDIIYPLVTPTTVQLTPTEVRTLLGNNNIFADTGDIEVKYLIEVI